jgi:hypothetical protein
MMIYAVGYGAGAGLMYTAPLMSAWSYFRNNKGLVTGIITSGFGFSIGAFGLITSKIVNPDNLTPDIEVHNGAVTEIFYSAEVANNVPFML